MTSFVLVAAARRKRRRLAAASLGSLIVMIACLQLTACGGAQTGATDTETGRYTLVRRGAWLWAAPDQERYRARDPLFNSDKGLVADVTVWRVVGEKAGWVQVENLPGNRPAGHCYRGERGLDEVRLRLWVQRMDLAPVTIGRFSATWGDGSHIILDPGISVGRKRVLRGVNPIEVRPVAFDGMTLEVTMKDSDIGTIYEPGKGFEITTRREHLDRTGEFFYGDGRRVDLATEGEPLLVQKQTYVTPTEVHYQARSRCYDVRFTGKPDATLAASSAGNPILAGGVVPCWRAVAGTPTVWPDGTAAGTARMNINFGDHGIASSEAAGVRCFEVPLRRVWPDGVAPSAEANLPLCFAETRLEKLVCGPAS